MILHIHLRLSQKQFIAHITGGVAGSDANVVRSTGDLCLEESETADH
jgi:hypothetical protein